MATGDESLGMPGALEEAFPRAEHRRRAVRFCRGAPGEVPGRKRGRAARMPKAIRAQESLEASVAKAEGVAADLGAMRPGAAAEAVRGGCAEALACTAFPMGRWVGIRTNNAIGRLNREIRGRTRVAGAFPDGKPAPMLATARLKHIAGSEWGGRRCLDVPMPKEVEAWGNIIVAPMACMGAAEFAKEY